MVDVNMTQFKDEEMLLINNVALANSHFLWPRRVDVASYSQILFPPQAYIGKMINYMAYETCNFHANLT